MLRRVEHCDQTTWLTKFPARSSEKGFLLRWTEGMILVAKLQKDSAHLRLRFCCCEVRVHLGSSVMRVGIASWNATCGVTKESEGFLDSTPKK
mmetsp:Transcript_69960/g.116552  ORF Transcript_69960/g.116552 Transcript_69960/m.116552 type:complete len:93 (+) Transcript_69960:1238-1516(+)